MAELHQFQIPDSGRTIEFFDSGVVVGEPTHKLCERFGRWKRVPDSTTVYWCGDDRIQFTLRVVDGIPTEIAEYPFDSIKEFKDSRGAGWAANAIYHPVGAAATGHILLKILEKSECGPL